MVQKVGTFYISVKVENSVFETYHVTYDLLNGTSGILIDNTESKDLKITSKNNFVLFVNNLIYTPKRFEDRKTTLIFFILLLLVIVCYLFYPIPFRSDKLPKVVDLIKHTSDSTISDKIGNKAFTSFYISLI